MSKKINKIAKYALPCSATLVLLVFIWSNLWPRPPVFYSGRPTLEKSENYYPGGAKCKAEELSKIRSTRKRLTLSESCDELFEDYRLKEDDLIQQTRAAKGVEESTAYAYQSVKVGVIQAILSILAVVFTGWAALAAAQAAGAAKMSVEDARAAAQSEAERFAQQLTAMSTSAAAATKSAAIAEKALTISERSYILVERLDARPTIKNGIHKGWDVSVVLKNSGRTVARNLVIWVNSRRLPVAEFNRFIFFEPDDLQADESVLAAGSTCGTDICHFPLQALDDIGNGTKVGVIWGFAEYATMFDDEERKSTQFCYVVHVIGDVRDQKQSPLAFRSYGPFNTVT